jgi:hypothetical protein
MRISVLYVTDTLEVGSRGRQRLLDRSWAWIGASVSRAELTAVWQLARRLQSKESPAEILAAHGGSSIMLRHLIAGEFDSECRLSLRMVRNLDPLAVSSRIRTLLGKLRTKLCQRRERLALRQTAITGRLCEIAAVASDRSRRAGGRLAAGRPARSSPG